MKLFFVFGTRPEAIKMAPLIIKARENPAISPVVCVTGQHREMLDQVLSLFEIKPDFDLKLMKANQTLTELSASCLEKLAPILIDEKPDCLIVQGDTTSAFVSALAAFYQKIPVAHVEAGLRTFDLMSPFPEEANRQLISKIASFHFPPTKKALENLKQEKAQGVIEVTGNTAIDALEIYLSKLDDQKEYEILKKYSLEDIDSENLILVTAHRRESFGAPFKNLCNALNTIVEKLPKVHLVYPVHLNPSVQDPVKSILGSNDRIHLIEPVSYDELIILMKRAKLILSDSGGIQEEAPSLGKPVIVLREKTERTEGVDAGVSILVGTDKEKIVSETLRLMENEQEYLKISRIENPYGDGKASEKILKCLLENPAGIQ